LLWLSFAFLIRCTHSLQRRIITIAPRLESINLSLLMLTALQCLD